MDNDLVQMEELLNLFEEREHAIKYTTFRIFDKIQQPVLETLIELFEIPPEKVEWNDIQFIAGALLMVCTITYDPHNVSPFIGKLFIPMEEDYQQVEVTKMMRIGVPITHAFKSKEEIRHFLTYVADKAYNENHPETVDLPQKIKDNMQAKFDTSELTEEQLIQLALYNNQGRGVKH